jgi:formate dehydrogenase subunit gamma
MRLLTSLVLALTFLFAGTALAQQQDPIKEQQQRQMTQPGNNAPVWRGVREEGKEHYTSIKGRETGVLVQSAGDTWRRIRNGPVTFYGGWLVVIVSLVILGLYFAKGPMKLHDKPTGRMIQRFSSAEVVVHWATAISFCVLGISGLTMLFGKYVVLPVIGYTLFSWLAQLAKNLHNFVAPFFIVCVLVMIVQWIKDNLPSADDLNWIKGAWGFFARHEHVPSGRFNAVEKGWFWGGVVVLSAVVAYTGTILLFANFDQTRATMQEAWIWHASAALLYIAFALGHIYMGTIGVEGAYQSMRTGYVDEVWAKEHHEIWYKAVKAGGAVAASGAIPAGAPHMREKS